MELGKKGKKAAGERVEQQPKWWAGREAGGEVNRPEECLVCFMDYNETERRPRTLPCGHTFCSSCVAGLIEGSQLACPTCRAQHPAPSSAHFPISYVTEALVRKLRDTVLTNSRTQAAEVVETRSMASGKSHRDSGAVISKRLQKLLQDEKKNLRSVLERCREVQSQLNTYLTQLACWKDRHQQQEDSLLSLLNNSRAAKDLLQQEEDHALAMREQGEAEEHQLEAMLGHLDTPSAAERAGAAIDDACHLVGQTENWMDSCEERFPNEETVTTSLKVLETTGAALNTAKRTLETVTAVAGATAVPAPPGGQASTIQERVQALTQPPVIQAEELQALEPRTRRLLEAGHVVAVTRGGGYSKMTVQDCRVYLHCLQDQPPSYWATTLQVSEVAPATLPCLVFMDLAWPGSPPQRVHIRLSPNTPRGRQFLLLCTGLRGPSYHGSRLCWVWMEGLPGEAVWGGDYQSNNREGGAALLTDLDQGNYWRSKKAGAVCGWDVGPKGAQFLITTRDSEDWEVYSNVFGEVESGLAVVREAARHRPITDVTVEDCGVVLRE